MAETSFPNSCAEDLKRHVMEIFEDVTKDCADEKLNSVFRTIGRSYDSLNDHAVHWFNKMADMGKTDKAREMFKPLSDLGILSEVAVFTIVISLYGSRNSESALKVFHHMIATGLNPVSCTYTQLICVLATEFSKVKYLRLAKKYFLEALDNGMKPDRTPFWKFIKAIAYREPLEKFKEFLQQIKPKGLVLHDYGFYYKEAYLAEARQVQKMQAHLIYSHTIDKDVRFYFYLKTATADYFHKLG